MESKAPTLVSYTLNKPFFRVYGDGRARHTIRSLFVFQCMPQSLAALLDSADSTLECVIGPVSPPKKASDVAALALACLQAQLRNTDKPIPELVETVMRDELAGTEWLDGRIDITQLAVDVCHGRLYKGEKEPMRFILISAVDTPLD